MSIKKPLPLPDTLSGLLRAAVADAQACQKAGYKLNMGTWHRGGSGNRGPCQVCMAGAVMAQRCGVRRGENSHPDYLEISTTKKLHAINNMRGGYFETAYETLMENQTDLDEGLVQRLDFQKLQALNQAHNLVVKAYTDQRNRAPWRVYLQAARVLEEAGL